jgi:hypothetical protein
MPVMLPQTLITFLWYGSTSHTWDQSRCPSFIFFQATLTFCPPPPTPPPPPLFVLLMLRLEAILKIASLRNVSLIKRVSGASTVILDGYGLHLTQIKHFHLRRMLLTHTEFTTYLSCNIIIQGDSIARGHKLLSICGTRANSSYWTSPIYRGEVHDVFNRSRYVYINLMFPGRSVHLHIFQ